MSNFFQGLSYDHLCQLSLRYKLYGQFFLNYMIFFYQWGNPYTISGQNLMLKDTILNKEVTPQN